MEWLFIIKCWLTKQIRNSKLINFCKKYIIICNILFILAILIIFIRYEIIYITHNPQFDILAFILTLNRNHILNITIIVYLISLLLIILSKIATNNIKNLNFRVGFGYDVHELKEGVPLKLCGENIPHSQGLISFSDGDVAIHALVDALLGAAGKYDIGVNFPNNDKKYENISSIEILKKTNKILLNQNVQIANIDLTIVAQKPVLAPFVEKMKLNIASTLKINNNIVNIKATTEEGLGFTGKLEGISCFCVVLVYMS